MFKKTSKRNQNPSRYYNSIPKSQVSTQAKISFFKNPNIKIDLLPWGPNSLKLLYSIMNLNTISLPTKERPINWGLYHGTNVCAGSPKALPRGCCNMNLIHLNSPRVGKKV
jgi:hypothetical protein